MKVVYIDWQTDGKKVSLPDTVDVPDNISKNKVADYLSDKYKFLVNGYVIERDFEWILYEYYQTEWLLSHGYSIYDVMSAVDEYFEEADVDIFDFQCTEDKIDEWIKNGDGLDGEIWAGYSEFCNNELLDEEYIKELISRLPECEQTELMEAYKEFLKKIRKRKDEVLPEGLICDAATV